MSAKETFAKALALSIDAALQPEKWEDVLNLVVDFSGATAFMVFEFDFETHEMGTFHSSTEFAIKGADLIASARAAMTPEESEVYDRFTASPWNKLVTEHELYGGATDSDLPDNPFREQVLITVGSNSRAGIKLNDVGPWSDVAVLHMPVRGQDIDPEIRRDIEIVGRVVARSLETGRVIRALTTSHQALLSAFDTLDFGAALVEPNGRIALANRTFVDTAKDRDGLTDYGGIAGATTPQDAENLHRILAQSVRPQAHPGALVSSLRRRSGQLPLVAKSAAIHSSDVSASTLVLLLIIDPEDETRLNAEGLAAFGMLTDAELEVCTHLIRGAPTEEIAERRSTSLETTRDQIKSARAKLACDSRLDLVRLALATRPPLISKK